MSNPPPTDNAALLHRILVHLEQSATRGRLEVVLAIVLSLSTLASTWCAYQANQWSGEQNEKQSAAATAERHGAEQTIIALQRRTFDGIEVLAYWEALRAKDAEASEAILARFRPALRKAVEASLAQGILTNPEVKGPLEQPDYNLPEELESQKLKEQGHALAQQARDADRASGQYILLTLMLASVLFFGGITGTFTNRRVRIALATIALLGFLYTMFQMTQLPVYKS
jgi:hypothetical protein